MNKHTPGCSNMDCTYSTCRTAHAKLIAAAPDMAEALKGLMTEWLEAPHGTASGMDRFIAARAALDKAGVAS